MTSTSVLGYYQTSLRDEEWADIVNARFNQRAIRRPAAC